MSAFFLTWSAELATVCLRAESCRGGPWQRRAGLFTPEMMCWWKRSKTGERDRLWSATRGAANSSREARPSPSCSLRPTAFSTPLLKSLFIVSCSYTVFYWGNFIVIVSVCFCFLFGPVPELQYLLGSGRGTRSKFKMLSRMSEMQPFVCNVCFKIELLTTVLIIFRCILQAYFQVTSSPLVAEVIKMEEEEEIRFFMS